MASYYQTKKTIPLLGGHICSKCKSVILTEFIFYSLANSRWTQKKAQKGADEAAEKGLKALRAFPEKPFLVCEVSEERTYSLVSGFGVELLNHSCPYCGHRERWQLDSSFAPACRLDPVTGVTLVTDVPEESRLTVLSDKDALDAWRVKVMAARAVNIRRYWEEHPAEAEQIRGQLRNLKYQIDVLNGEKAAIRERTRLRQEEVESKEAQMKGYSLFSAERKAAKAELNALKKQCSAQSATDSEREKTVTGALAGLEKQVKELKIANPGVLGEMETVTPKDAPYCQAIRMS